MPLVEPVTNAVLPCNMISAPKDELGCLKVHYHAAHLILATSACGTSQIAVDRHEPSVH
jgi:hypothetical protein